MITLNWFDLTLVLVVLWSAVSGMRSGLARVVIGFIAGIVGLIAAFWCYRQLADELMPWIKTPAVASVTAFVIIFIGVLILGSLLSTLLSRMFQWMGISWLDRLLGGVAGFLRGTLVIAALTDVIVAYSPSPTPAFLEQSRVLPYAGEIASMLATVAPRQLKDAFDEQLENLRRYWKQPANQPPASTARIAEGRVLRVAEWRS